MSASLVWWGRAVNCRGVRGHFNFGRSLSASPQCSSANVLKLISVYFIMLLILRCSLKYIINGIEGGRSLPRSSIIMRLVHKFTARPLQSPASEDFHMQLP
jgi:hypothetical protein